MSSNILLLLLILLLIYLIHKKKEREKERTFVSMTSDDAHLPFIHKTLDSLLNGQLSPDKIILNLPNHKHNIPISLTHPKYKESPNQWRHRHLYRENCYFCWHSYRCKRKC